jgi:urease accessory protein
MLLVDAVVGDHADPLLHDRLHDLEHKGAVEVVKVATVDLDRRRLKVRTDKGADVAIALPRDQKLFDGAVLLLDEARAIVVRAGEQRWLRLSPRSPEDALELGYHAGNLHWRVRFEGSDLLVSLDGPAAIYVARIAAMVDGGRVTAAEEAE